MAIVKVEVDLRDLEAIMGYAQRCAEDLVAEVEQANPGSHPVTVRRRERDTFEARWLLSALPSFAIKYRVEIDDLPTPSTDGGNP